MANSVTLPFTIYNMIIRMGMRYCLWVYDWLLESILWFILCLCTWMCIYVRKSVITWIKMSESIIGSYYAFVTGFANLCIANKHEFLCYDFSLSNIRFNFFINRLNISKFRYCQWLQDYFFLHEFWFDSVFLYFLFFLFYKIFK